MRQILLTQGKFALVDDEDYEWLNQWKWCTQKGRNTYYAGRNTPTQNGKRQWVLMHREILGLSKGEETDHQNGNGLDNRKCNLRLCTVAQNQQNQRKKGRCPSSIFKGVYWYSAYQKWRVLITYNYKKIHLGYFGDEAEAAKAYDRKAIELFGEFAHTNF